MNISAPFIRRPVATSLLAAALLLAGLAAFTQLPVSPLPQVDFPTIQVSAALPGASPTTMASAVATPLERRFGRIAGLTEMTSASALGSTTITHAVRSRPQRRRGGARRAGGDQRRGRRAAVEPADAPELPQGQPGRLADPDPVADARTRCRWRRSSTPPTASWRRRSRRSAAWGRSSWAAGSSRRCACRPTCTRSAAWASACEDVRARCRPSTSNQPKGSIASGGVTYCAGRQRPAAGRRRLPQALIIGYAEQRRHRAWATSPTSSTTSRTTASRPGATRSARCS